MRRNAVCMVSRGAERRSSCTVICTYPVGYIGMSNAICALGSCSVNAVAGDRIFIGQSTIGTSLFELETPYADPHVRCCERCDAKHPPTRLFLIPEKEIRPETHALPSDWPSALRRRPGTRRVCQAPVSRGKAKAPGQELACGASLFLIGDGFELIFPEVNPDISVIIFQSAQGAPRHQHNPEFWLQGNRK